MKTKNLFTNRIFSIFLSIAMLLTLVPSFSLTAFAAAITLTYKAGEGTGEDYVKTTSSSVTTHPSAERAGITPPVGKLLWAWRDDETGDLYLADGLTNRSSVSTSKSHSFTAVYVEPAVRVTVDGVSTEYASLEAAFNQANRKNKDFTIDILDDVELIASEKYKLTYIKSLTLNLNGHSIIGKYSSNITFSNIPTITINGQGTISLDGWSSTNVTLDFSGSSSQPATMTINGNVQIERIVEIGYDAEAGGWQSVKNARNAINVGDYATLIMNGGTASVSGAGHNGNGLGIAGSTSSALVVNTASAAEKISVSGNTYFNVNPQNGYTNASSTGTTWYKIDNQLVGAEITIDNTKTCTYDDNTYATAGATVTVTPKTDYTLTSVQYTDASNTSQNATASGGNYTFTMPAAVTKITGSSESIHTHDWEYTVSGNTITAKCKISDSNCTNTDGGYVTITKPTELTYTGEAIEAIVDDQLTTGATVSSVRYTGENLVGGKPVNAGTYTATVSVGGKEISVEYSIKKVETISVTTQPTKTAYTEGETFDPAGMVVTATYSDGTTKEVSDYTYSPTGALTPDVTAVTISYKQNGVTATATVNITVAAKKYNVVVDYVNSNEGTVTADKSVATEGETVTLTITPAPGYLFYNDNGVVGVVKVYYGDRQEVPVNSDNTFIMPASDVKISVTFAKHPTGSAAIIKSGFSGATATLSKTSGILVGESITLTFTPDEGKVFITPPTVMTIMGSGKAGPVTAGENGVYTCEISNIQVGNTEYKHANIYVSGTAVSVYTVTVPAEQIGYKLETSATELLENGSATLTFTLDNGYSTTNEFAVTATGATITDNGDGTYTISNAQDDVVITVTGVADVTAPNVTLSVKNVGWKQFINKVTFGLFFKENVEIKVESTDLGSKIQKAEYLITETAFTTEDAVKADASVWTALTLENGVAKFNVTEKGKKYVYVRVIDNDGNITVVNSDGGVVVYTDSTADTTAISFIKTTTDGVTARVNLNGNTVKAIYNGTDLVDSGNYSVATDGTITFNAAYLDTLAEGTYTLHIVYDPQGENYVESDINEAPAKTNITLNVGKQTGTVKITNDISKTYDGQAVSAPTYDRNNVSGTVVVEYKKKDADDKTYSTDAPKNAGDYTVRVTVKADDAGFYTEAVSAPVNFTISQKDVTIDGVTVEASKVYDGKTTATITANGTPSDNYDGDKLTVTVGEANYADKNVGEGKTVTFSGFALSGDAAKNYNLTAQPADVTADIAKKAVTVSATVPDRIYGDDWDVDTSKVVVTFDGIVDGDDVGYVVTDAFYHAHTVTNNAPVQVVYNVNGVDAENYQFPECGDWRAPNYPVQATGRVLPRDIANAEIVLGDALTYTGKELTQTVADVTVDGLKVTYDISGNKATKVGVYKLTVTANGNFTGTKTVLYEIAPDTTAIGDLTVDNVKSSDKEAIEAVKATIENAVTYLADDEKKAEYKAITDKCDELLKNISNTAADIDRINDALDGYDSATVTSDDKAGLEELLAEIEKQLKSTNLTDEEISELNGNKTAVQDLLAKIKGAQESDKSTDSHSPATGDNSNLWLLFALAFISGGSIFGITLYNRKRKTANK